MRASTSAFASICHGPRCATPAVQASAEILKSGGLPPNKAPHGPHCALGTIYYPRKAGETDDTNSTGVLLYIKSSFTGDENDYVVDYKRRNPDFPHETRWTSCSPRSSSRSIAPLAFTPSTPRSSRTDKVAMNPDPATWQGPTSTIPLEKRMHDILA